MILLKHDLLFRCLHTNQLIVPDIVSHKNYVWSFSRNMVHIITLLHACKNFQKNQQISNTCGTKRISHLHIFQLWEKFRVSTCFHSSRRLGPGHLKLPMGLQMHTMLWSLSSQALARPKSVPHRAWWHGVTFCQGMQQQRDFQQEQQKRWRSTLQCPAVPLLWGLNWLATWQHDFIFSQTAWSEHHELLAWTKQEKGTSTEGQELRFTINLLTSDPNRKQATT